MANNIDVSLNDIRDFYLLRKLATTNFRYRVFTSEGEYVETVKNANLKVGTINAIMSVENTDIMVLGGGIKAVSLSCKVSFLIPIDDYADAVTHNYPMLEEFKQGLTSIFPASETLNMTIRNVTCVGAFSAGYPIPGFINQRQYIGNSMEYTVYIEVAYLQNAINSNNIKFYLDSFPSALPVSAFNFSRRSVLLGNVYSDSANTEARVYAESSSFGVDLAMPAVSPATGVGALIYKYTMGEIPANEAHTLKIVTTVQGDNGSISYTKAINVIFGEVFYDGAGTDNVSTKVSFVPYVGAEG